MVVLPRFNGKERLGMKMRRRGIWEGLLVAAILTAALIAIFFVAWRVAGLPFVPFDMFDWLKRLLPGRLIALGIGTMVTVIRALNLGRLQRPPKRQNGQSG
jgi:hypothetical protein